MKLSKKTRKKKHSALFLACVLAIGGLPFGAASTPVSAAASPQALITTTSGTTSYDIVQGEAPAAIVVDPEIVIHDSSYTDEIDGAIVLIENFQSGDRLLFTVASGISGDYNDNNGVLTLTGKAPAVAYKETLSSVRFVTSSNDDSPRNIKFSLGDALPYDANGHFYKYVNKGAYISWDDAKEEAEKDDYFGRQGYLVTITSEQENEFVREKTLGLGWIGAQDIERKNGQSIQHGDWRWVTGPEGLENNGEGEPFYDGYAHISGNPLPGKYSNWANDEPNNYNGVEYVAHIFGPNDRPGQWNDYSPTNASVEGYVIEYGGMPNDTDYEIIATKSVIFVDVTDLKEAVDDLGQLEEKDYMEAEWPEFKQALENARAVLSDRQKTDQEVDNALKALQDAKDKLQTRIKITEPGGNNIYVARPVIKGEAAPDADVAVVFKDSNNNVIGPYIVKADSEGAWSVVTDQDFPDGDYVLEAIAVKNGQSNNETRNVKVDTTKPELAITEPAGNLVATSTPEVKGNADPEAKVTVELKDNDGRVIETVEVDVDSNGNWSSRHRQSLQTDHTRLM
ncbi:hypothetical protein ABDI30_14500 [Paenibacillus cisolokensis]|uniref:hypothetical protein n=1 Tax=Paenibacillus cisolokensis TaxID=1658519 RepID=UPI003D2C1F95